MRRSFLFLTLLLLAFAPALSSAAPDKPNILWLVSEDNDLFLGCYGDPIAHTPTLDKLAHDGVLYEHCFGWPVCAPSRFALITGMYGAACGPGEHMRAQGKIPSWLKGFPTFLHQAGYFTSNNAKTDYNSPIDPKATWDLQGKEGHWRKRPDPAQPFFSVFNHEVTHESCLFPEKELPLDFPSTDPAKVRIPPYQPDTPEMRADWVRYYNHMRLMDEQIAAKLKDLEADGLADNTIVFYYSDNGGVLPRSKRFLEESGTHVPLIIYFPPKWRHLAPAAPGSRIKEPVSFVNFAATVLSLAGVKVPDYMQGRAFAGPGQAPPNEYAYITRDRMDERYDMMRSVMDQRWLYVRNFRPDLAYVQPLEYQFKARGYQSWARVAAEGKLTAATAQFWGTKPSEELYDTVADPDSVKNLAADPGRREILDRMRAELRRRVVTINDNGFLPEGSAIEGYDASHQPGAFPVERVFALAALASDRDPKNLPKLMEALDDPNEPIRWWAAQGCTMLAEKAAPAEAALRQRLSDDSGAVQVAAAEALARQGHLDAALPVLERCLQNLDAPWFALQAGNVFDRLGKAARPSLPILKQMLAKVGSPPNPNSGPAYIQRILTHAVDVLEGRTAAFVYPNVVSETDYGRLPRKLHTLLEPKQRALQDLRLVVTDRQIREIEGWTVLVSNELLQKEKPATDHALELLTAHLKEINRVVPAAAAEFLHTVPLWISPEYPGIKPHAEYHPNIEWLRENGRNPAMAKGVEFTNVRIFEAETQRMPVFVLHELAHAYHDQVLGFRDAAIKAAYERAKASGSYDSVERWNGPGKPVTRERAYAMTNEREYFSETTEAFFGRNDFFPFTREELARHDPEIFQLLQQVWMTGH